MSSASVGVACADFRARHLAWLDSALRAAEAAMLRGHADICGRCARYDAEVRAGLLLARHVVPVRVSAGFRARLAERLRCERRTGAGRMIA